MTERCLLKISRSELGALAESVDGSTDKRGLLVCVVTAVLKEWLDDSTPADIDRVLRAGRELQKLNRVRPHLVNNR